MVLKLIVSCDYFVTLVAVLTAAMADSTAAVQLLCYDSYEIWYESLWVEDMQDTIGH